MGKFMKKKSKAKKSHKKAPAKRKVARKTGAVRKKAKKTGAKRKSGLTQMTYNCSEELQALGLGKKATRPEVVKKMWAYIKAHKCQDTKNRRMINPDKKLSEVIGNRPVDMLQLAKHISKHLSS
jgi:chromatin remodeling complex protein RSC6